MYIFLFFLLAPLVMSPDALAEEIGFHEIDGASARHMLCPCEFRESFPGVPEGSYGSGDAVLLIAPNEARPYAMVNLGRGNRRLEPVVFARYVCEKGNAFSTTWKSDGIIVTADLLATAAGEEACWFEGSLTAKAKASAVTVRVKGGC